jgi:Transcriptional regulators
MAATLETIALRVGVSKATVSLALRGSTRISAEIRERVARAADELGYSPNPLVSALMVSLRAQGRVGRAFDLCFLTAFPTRDGWREFPAFHRYHAGALARAKALGYGLEIHWTGDTPGDDDRLTRLLESRGIPGVLIAPLPRTPPAIPLDWSRFATVALGHTFKQASTHRVTNNQFHTILTALTACHERGYRRIGLAAPSFSDARVNHIWLAGILSFQTTHAGLRKIPPLMADPFTPEVFFDWFRRETPEVVITTEREVFSWLRAHGCSIPDDVACVHLDWTPELGDLAAVDQRPEHVGEAAVDLLVEQINQNRRGRPGVPQTVLIEGVWRDGPTLPARIPARPATRRARLAPAS